MRARKSCKFKWATKESVAKLSPIMMKHTSAFLCGLPRICTSSVSTTNFLIFSQHISFTENRIESGIWRRFVTTLLLYFAHQKSTITDYNCFCCTSCLTNRLIASLIQLTECCLIQVPFNCINSWALLETQLNIYMRNFGSPINAFIWLRL